MSRRAWRRGGIACAAVFVALVVGGSAVGMAWLDGMHVPLVSGATYLRVEKVATRGRADRVAGALTTPFFLLLVGNDSRPGVGGARGDALHVLGVNPARHQASMIDVPRDTCWQGQKINVGNTHGPRAQANDVGGLLGVNIAFVIDVDFAGFTGLVDGVGGFDVNVPTAMHDAYSGAFFTAGVHHMNGLDALAFSRDRHDFPQSDIIRTSNQGRLILDAMRELRTKMQTASGEFKLLALLGRHAQLDGIGIKDLYHLGRLAFSLEPDQIKNITVPYTGGRSCLTVGATAAGLFADFRDDALVESH
ncbi:MAG: polyisoprenyl-teichoic acid--peptidoglycan teichoic acid transferase [Actinomycetota bacterium]|nr:polyisoprenyl-teichoic acid--peptidoglycan teichoic acid transferase [Actinomycetota bacterium]